MGSQGVCSGAQDPGQQQANPEARELLDGGPGTVQERERAISGDSDPIRDPGQEVQQGQETAEGLPAEVSCRTQLFRSYQ